MIWAWSTKLLLFTIALFCLFGCSDWFSAMGIYCSLRRGVYNLYNFGECCKQNMTKRSTKAEIAVYERMIVGTFGSKTSLSMTCDVAFEMQCGIWPCHQGEKKWHFSDCLFTCLQVSPYPLHSDRAKTSYVFLLCLLMKEVNHCSLLFRVVWKLSYGQMSSKPWSWLVAC